MIYQYNKYESIVCIIIMFCLIEGFIFIYTSAMSTTMIFYESILEKRYAEEF